MKYSSSYTVADYSLASRSDTSHAIMSNSYTYDRFHFKTSISISCISKICIFLAMLHLKQILIFASAHIFAAKLRLWICFETILRRDFEYFFTFHLFFTGGWKKKSSSRTNNIHHHIIMTPMVKERKKLTFWFDRNEFHLLTTRRFAVLSVFARELVTQF